MSIALVLLLLPAPGQEVVSRLFAATSQGAFVSYSWGEHWTRLRGGLRGFEGEIRAFACLGPTVYAGGTGGMFVSDDFGENFRPIESWPGGEAEVTVLLPARLFALEPALFVGTTKGLFRTKDAGGKWTRVGASELRGTVHALEWPGPELFAATDGGLHRTNDMGESWLPWGEGLPDAPVLAVVASRFFSADPTVFVGTEGKGLYRSDDAGEHFHPVGGDSLSNARVGVLFWWQGLLLVGTDRGLFLTDDGGMRLRKARELEGLAIHAISVPGAEAEVPSDVIVGTNRGVLKSSDGAQRFRRVQEGMGSLEVLSLATFPMPPQTRERRRR